MSLQDDLLTDAHCTGCPPSHITPTLAVLADITPHKNFSHSSVLFGSVSRGINLRQQWGDEVISLSFDIPWILFPSSAHVLASFLLSLTFPQKQSDRQFV